MRKILFHASCLMLLLATSCSREDFAAINTDPEALQTENIDLKTLFPNAVLALHGNDFEAYYDIHRNIQYWIGAWVPLAGNGAIITRFKTPITASKYPYRFDNLYSREKLGAGGHMVEMRHMIDILPAADAAKFQHIRAISYIPEAYAAFNLSDIIGSIAYTDAFKARYTNPPVLTPTFDTQEALFDSLDKRLKASVAVLKQTFAVTQETLGTSDMYYHGTGTEATNWAMAANALRLKLAMRILKRKPDAAKTIILEVLADNVGPINSRAGSWVFKGGPSTANGGNYALATGISGQKALVDFMYKNTDPRIRNIYQKVALTVDQFNAAKTAGTIPATEVYQEYRGRYTSPDATTENDKKFYFNYITGTTAYSSYIQSAMFNSAIGGGLVNFPVMTYAAAKTAGTIPATEVYQEYRGRYTSPDATTENDKKFYFNYITGTTAYSSYIQSAMFNSAIGGGLVNFPVITYADVCFMRAELAARGVTTEVAADWYYKGIDASIADYDEWGKDAKVIGYTALTTPEVTAYKAQADIVYSAVKGVEQIAVQQYINFYRNPNESWALIKRTGYPSQTGVVFQAEKIRSGGVEAVMPRRWSLFIPPVTDLNYANRKAAVEAMQKDASLGDLSDITGRVWWDMP